MTPAQTLLDPPRPAVDRALAYGWLSALFARELEAESLTAYGGPEWRPLLDALAGDPALEPAVAALRALPLDDAPTLALDLAVAYARLFHGVDGPKSVPPYESAYVSPRGTLFQAPVSEMGALIAGLDLSLTQAYAEPPDHLAVELAVMAEMARRLDAALARGMTAGGVAADAVDLAANQKSLLDDHLLVWLPEFRDGCQARQPDSLYAVAARAALAFARQDRVWLDLVLAAA